MGDHHLNLPKAPSQLLASSSSSIAPPPPPQWSNMPIFYYGLVVVATAAIVLAVYNLIIVRWCATQYRRSREAHDRRNSNIMMTSSQLAPSLGGSSAIGSFRYKKGSSCDNVISSDHENMMECSVCLSVFEEGEEVTKLPSCKHSFHASCIDMWLHSHFDCPLCRAPVLIAPDQFMLDSSA